MVEPVPALAQRSEGALGEGDGPGGAHRRVRGLGGELREVRGASTASRLGGRRGGQVQAALQHTEGVQRCLDREREAARRDRRLPGLVQPVGAPPVRGGHGRTICEGGGERGPVPRPLRGQEVGHDGARHQLVPDGEAVAGLPAHEPVLQRLGETRGEVRVQALGAAPRERRWIGAAVA